MTPLKCLPWEWTLGPKTGQKRALSLRYPLRNWKTRQNSEKSCFHQNQQKHENHQKSENHKNSKSDKTRKWKNRKSDKSEKWKSDKKVSKMHTPPKWPKCQINDQNRHFVKSEPPGPAFFEFQGVPRDPVLRPKMTPSFLNVKCDHVLCFWSFSNCAFCCFCSFSNCAFWCFVRKWHFVTVLVAITIRPYCVNIGRDRE